MATSFPGYLLGPSPPSEGRAAEGMCGTALGPGEALPRTLLAPQAGRASVSGVREDAGPMSRMAPSPWSHAALPLSSRGLRESRAVAGALPPRRGPSPWDEGQPQAPGPLRRVCRDTSPGAGARPRPGRGLPAPEHLAWQRRGWGEGADRAVRWEPRPTAPPVFALSRLFRGLASCRGLSRSGYAWNPGTSRQAVLKMRVAPRKYLQSWPTSSLLLRRQRDAQPRASGQGPGSAPRTAAGGAGPPCP